MCRVRWRVGWYKITVELWSLGTLSFCFLIWLFIVSSTEIRPEGHLLMLTLVIRVPKTMETQWLRRNGRSLGDLDSEERCFSLSCPKLDVLMNCHRYWPHVLIFPSPAFISHPLENCCCRHLLQKQPMWLIISGLFFFFPIHLKERVSSLLPSFQSLTVYSCLSEQQVSITCKAYGIHILLLISES